MLRIARYVVLGQSVEEDFADDNLSCMARRAMQDRYQRTAERITSPG
jgi:hypothetical protein